MATVSIDESVGGDDDDMKGGSKRSDQPVFNMKGDTPIEPFGMFMMSKQTFGIV